MSVWLRYLLCVAQETHWLNPNYHPHHSPYSMSSHSACRHTVHGMTSDVLFFGWSFRKSSMAAVVLSVGVFQYEACHTCSFIILPASQFTLSFCSQLFIEAFYNILLCFVLLGDFYVNLSPPPTHFWDIVLIAVVNISYTRVRIKWWNVNDSCKETRKTSTHDNITNKRLYRRHTVSVLGIYRRAKLNDTRYV